MGLLWGFLYINPVIQSKQHSRGICLPQDFIWRNKSRAIDIDLLEEPPSLTDGWVSQTIRVKPKRQGENTKKTPIEHQLFFVVPLIWAAIQKKNNIFSGFLSCQILCPSFLSIKTKSGHRPLFWHLKDTRSQLQLLCSQHVSTSRMAGWDGSDRTNGDEINGLHPWKTDIDIQNI